MIERRADGFYKDKTNDTIMITVISLLILACLMLGRPVGWLAEKLDGTDWKGLAQDAWEKIVTYSKKAGRSSTRPVLRFYYAMTESDLSVMEKTLVYAAIIYIAVPRDFLPKSVVGWLGVLDDAGAAAFVYAKVKKNITPEIERMTEATLDKWFGYEVVRVQIPDLREK